METDIVKRLRSAEGSPSLKRVLLQTKNAEDTCLEAAAEIERLRALTTWRPIETAPKDGTRILCASIGNSDRFDMVERKIIHDQTLKVHWVSTGEWSHKYERFWDRFEPCGFSYLTHWLPISPPPGKADGE